VADAKVSVMVKITDDVNAGSSNLTLGHL